MTTLYIRSGFEMNVGQGLRLIGGTAVELMILRRMWDRKEI